MDKRNWVEEKLNAVFLTNLGCSEEEFVRLNEDNLDFRKVNNKNEYHKFIMFFYRLQQYFVSHSVKSFALVPVGHLGRKHIKYSNTGLKDMQKAVIQEMHKEKYNTNKSRNTARASDVCKKEKAEQNERTKVKRELEKEKQKLHEKKRALQNKIDNLYQERKFKKKETFEKKVQDEIDQVKIELDT